MKKCKCGGEIRKFVMCGGTPKRMDRMLLYFEECQRCFRTKNIYAQNRKTKRIMKTFKLK